MKLAIVDNRVEMTGKIKLGEMSGPLADVSVTFDEVQEAIDFAAANHLDLTADPIVHGFNLGGMAVAIGEGKMDEALVHAGLVFSTDVAWVECLRKLATIITSAADELESKS